ncbi:hypothetical protein DLAC_07556 [Tieghemostelium lacteum]|uniref:Uncharacterized protein n=1 Tax=Tieghemostelium lacteum TaxID=361077 RepID=A0A151ZCW4_TIELA|nr:hypothetical protein DLAC_07556 [Tieghemostelium lacteum]|eukprot:KYQ91765.1 hypothetical protein DLAC_07556 [Tieghemostelium lacteum]
MQILENQKIIIPLPYYLIKRILNFYLSLTEISGYVSRNVKVIERNIRLISMVSKQWNENILPRLANPYFLICTGNDITTVSAAIKRGYKPRRLLFMSNSTTLMHPQFYDISPYITKYYCHEEGGGLFYQVLASSQLGCYYGPIPEKYRQNIGTNVKIIDLQMETKDKYDLFIEQLGNVVSSRSGSKPLAEWSLEEMNLSFKYENVTFTKLLPFIKLTKCRRLTIRDTSIGRALVQCDEISLISSITSLSILNFTIEMSTILTMVSQFQSSLVNLSLRNIKFQLGPTQIQECTQFDQLFKSITNYLPQLKTFYFDPYVITSVGKVSISRVCKLLNLNQNLQEFHSSVLMNEFKLKSHHTILSDTEKYRISNTTLKRITGCNLFLKNHILQFWTAPSSLKEISITNMNPMISKAVCEIHSQSLETLIITNIRYFNKDLPFHYLMSSFVQPDRFSSLKTLNLASNEYYIKHTKTEQGVQDWVDFFKLVKNNRNLTTLSLYKFDIPPECVVEFIESNHPVITYFSVELLVDKMYPSERLINAICSNNRLSGLNIASILPTDTVMENYDFILQVLQKNQTIQHLNFNDNPISMTLTAEEANILSKTLQNNTSILTFLSDQIYELIPDAYVKSSKLSSFDSKLNNNYLFNLK